MLKSSQASSSSHRCPWPFTSRACHPFRQAIINLSERGTTFVVSQTEGVLWPEPLITVNRSVPSKAQRISDKYRVSNHPKKDRQGEAETINVTCQMPSALTIFQLLPTCMS